MNPRGAKHYAVMGIGARWKKPKFLYETPSRRIVIFDTRTHAEHYRSHLEEQGIRMVFGGKEHVVKWIVAPVWSETIVDEG